MLNSTKKKLIIIGLLLATSILLGPYFYSSTESVTRQKIIFKGYFSLNEKIMDAWKEYVELNLENMDKPKDDLASEETLEEETYENETDGNKTDKNETDKEKAVDGKTAENNGVVARVSPPKTNGKNIVGYYSGWSAYSGYTPDKIAANKLTHINYAFANIGSDLKIMLGDANVDSANFKKLNNLKKTNKDLKILISVGGWTWSDKFSDAALTDKSRAVFADSVVDFLVKYELDGVDLDWEYPVAGGLSKNKKRPEDKQNFTLLLKTIREKLDKQSTKDGKYYLLTFSGGTSKLYVDNVELKKISQYVDFANIMTYDIHGDWDKYTDFNAPLYSFSATSPHHKWSVDSSVNLWLNAGFPAKKLNMGIPFYGYRYDKVEDSNNGFLQGFSGAKSITYKDIMGLISSGGFTRHFHSESKVPWIYNGSTYISYDDEESIGVKAQYIKSKGLGGAMIWELSQDPSELLLNTIYNNIR